MLKSNVDDGQNSGTGYCGSNDKTRNKFRMHKIMNMYRYHVNCRKNLGSIWAALVLLLLLNLTLVLIFERRHESNSPLVTRTVYVKEGAKNPPSVEVLGLEEGPMISRKIHMTWKDPHVPSWAQYNVETWRSLNADYEWILHTDAQMDKHMRQNHEDLLPIWEKLIPIQKADFFRYIIVLDEGGVYADLDVTCRLPVDQWAGRFREFNSDVRLIVGFEAVVGQRELDLHYFARKFQVAQWVFAAAPNHPVLQNVIRIIVDKLTPMSPNEVATASVIRTTGPAVWSDAVAEYIEKYGIILGENSPRFGDLLTKNHVKNKASHIGDMLLLPEVAFGSRDGYDLDGQLVVHNFQGTWKGDKPMVPVPPKNPAPAPDDPMIITYQKAMKELGIELHGPRDEWKKKEADKLAKLVSNAKPHCVTKRGVRICVPKGSQSPEHEDSSKLLDENDETKWLSFLDMKSTSVNIGSNSTWLVNAEAITWVTVDLRQKKSFLSSQSAVPQNFSICAYSITSADDFTRRDPWAWRLLALVKRENSTSSQESLKADKSVTGNETSHGYYPYLLDIGEPNTLYEWKIIDSRMEEIFAKRKQRRTFKVAQLDKLHTDSPKAYRLDILRVKDPSTADSVQFAELDFLQCANESQGNNNPLASSIIHLGLSKPSYPPPYTQANFKDSNSSVGEYRYKYHQYQIPRIIHQTWSSPHVPAKFESYVRSWIKINPKWQYILWTDSEADFFMATYFPSYLQMYRGYESSIQRADALRYFILYAYGGIYVDMDMEALSSLDTYLSKFYDQSGRLLNPHTDFSGIILSQEPAAHSKVLYNKNRLACNAAMLSAPGHPFWSHSAFPELMHRKDIKTVRATGPKMLQGAVDRYTALTERNTDNVHLPRIKLNVHDISNNILDIFDPEPEVNNRMNPEQHQSTHHRVFFAAPEAFFPTFDTSNENLRTCCLQSTQTHCGVDDEHPPVEGRLETCRILSAYNFDNPPGQAKYNNSVAKHHWAHTWWSPDHYQISDSFIHINGILYEEWGMKP